MIVAIVLLTLLFDTVVVVGSPGQIGAAYFGPVIGSALAAGTNFANTKAQANAQIAAELRRFFAEYPSGNNFAQAEKEYAVILSSSLGLSLPSAAAGRALAGVCQISAD